MAEALRVAVLSLLQLVLLPLLVGCWLERLAFTAERWFGACAELLALAPGWPGSMVRKAFYRATLPHCATRAYFGFGAIVVRRAARIGRGVYVGPYSIIGAADIDDGVKIASRVSILSGRHQHGDAGGGATATPRFERVRIGAQAWIGEGAIVMADVGRAAIVGAGSVVVSAVPPGATVVGNPARSLDRGRALRGGRRAAGGGAMGRGQ